MLIDAVISILDEFEIRYFANEVISNASYGCVFLILQAGIQMYEDE